MNDPTEPKINSLRFYKTGILEAFGTVNGEYVEIEVNASSPTFDELKPIEPSDYECTDAEGLYCATLDDWYNLHWQLRIGGNIITRVVRLKEIVEQLLYDKYIKL